jgi:hypothetical protein
MQSALIAGMISIALVTWLPDVASAMRKPLISAAFELNDATGDDPMVMADSAGG